MGVALKGFLQGSIPVVVFVGGAHHLTKKLKTSKPVLYYGSLLAGLGLAYAVVEGKIKAPFMNAEDDDLYYCSKCDEGFSSINPTDEGQFCDSCLPSSATLHDEMERITMDAETFEAEYPKFRNYKGIIIEKTAKNRAELYSDMWGMTATLYKPRKEGNWILQLTQSHPRLGDRYKTEVKNFTDGLNQYLKFSDLSPLRAETFENNHTIEVSKGDVYAVRPKIRKWIRAMQEKGFSYIIRKDQTGVFYDEEGNKFDSQTPEFLVYEIGNIDDITDWVEADSMDMGFLDDEMKLYISTKNNEIYTSRYGETNRHASRSVIYFPAKGIGLPYGLTMQG